MITEDDLKIVRAAAEEHYAKWRNEAVKYNVSLARFRMMTEALTKIGSTLSLLGEYTREAFIASAEGTAKVNKLEGEELSLFMAYADAMDKNSQVQVDRIKGRMN